jgi:hypothetical protein
VRATLVTTFHAVVRPIFNTALGQGMPLSFSLNQALTVEALNNGSFMLKNRQL